jgi:uncharacterized protein YndB with AHSA1/START domain
VDLPENDFTSLFQTPIRLSSQSDKRLIDAITKLAITRGYLYSKFVCGTLGDVGGDMPDIDHEIKIKAPQTTVFTALTTVEGLRAWHTSWVDGNADAGGVIAMHSDPEFEWRVAKAEQPHRIEWECIKGPGNSVGTTARFDLSTTADGRTFVELSHAGWIDTGANYRKCNTRWGILLHHLRKYAETGKADPVFTSP